MQRTRPIAVSSNVRTSAIRPGAARNGYFGNIIVRYLERGPGRGSLGAEVPRTMKQASTSGSGEFNR
ncbi:hypothetical protein MRX96_017691 [Rhipicephalus microplus]